MPPFPSPLVAMRGICKSFSGIPANVDVDLTLGRGEILGLLGENGAGKTTLMNILFGAYRADAGTIAVEGRPLTIARSADALAAGIGMVHQHFHLAPRLSVLDNLLVGLPGRGGRLDRTGGLDGLARIERQFSLALDPDRPVSTLVIGEQQRLEIVKALLRGARILILDEPTAVLTPAEVDGLFAALRAMAAQGLGIIFISHKLNEVRALTHRCLVLRHGRVAGEIEAPADTSAAAMARLMCGQEIVPPVRPPATKGDVVLALDGISTAGHAGMPLRRASLSVRAGEIVGIAGVSGNGQTALAGVIAGMITPSEGGVTVRGETIKRFTPNAMMARRVGRIPEDRMTDGLVTSLPLADSLVLPRIGTSAFSRGGLLKPGAILAFAQEQIRAFDIRCPGPMVRAGALSGGNLQKALLARELALDPAVLVAAQPTRGLDIGATRFVHEKFLALRARGCGLVVISEDLEELLTLSDRIAVLYEGKIAGVLDASEATVARIGLLMSGVREAA
ncbi:ABC transporter ATP-binding protein [Labrys wisconsinensis]|uniref:Simple sugar transport system ATP-binding protein n=1 Tax=Labrys wisconsinensis TaxID=425677 RepID=A0ABU0JJ52_9HYPH|nr:ABC transporter ATP-binding protein [Labrys wisconsinensis]MDQ0473162.1 simple sugar transport system ATP-binding protein [Labrys wisconsinensis]